MAALTPVTTPWNSEALGSNDGVKDRHANSSATHNPGRVNVSHLRRHGDREVELVGSAPCTMAAAVEASPTSSDGASLDRVAIVHPTLTRRHNRQDSTRLPAVADPGPRDSTYRAPSEYGATDTRLLDSGATSTAEYEALERGRSTRAEDRPQWVG